MDAEYVAMVLKDYDMSDYDVVEELKVGRSTPEEVLDIICHHECMAEDHPEEYDDYSWQAAATDDIVLWLRERGLWE